MPENVVFGWPRWTDGVAWSGGAWQADYPVANLGTLPLARVARSASLAPADTQIVGTLAKDRQIRLFALVRHNLTVTARYRLRLYADAARTVVLYDTGWVDVWPILYPWPTVEWEDDRWWTGTYTAEELEGYIWTRPIWLPEQVLARAFLLELDDPSNTAGFVELGLLEVARGWQPSLNVSYGYSTGRRTRSLMVEALGGSKYFDRRDAPRMVKADIQNLPRAEAMTGPVEMVRQLGVDTPVLWFPFPDRVQDWVRDCFLGRLVDPAPLTIPHYNRMSFPVQIEEIL
ncbi:hypothetical protein KTR66_04710 [Roseococcus sp. SDR]|uniref:hypothetical protein n=1 Tax=Roseococcus sp. SDR TaxID=2835532 RepID=UPI001BD1618F|nr:hypothetical protein [Roseococcus sp. SDR]MBS7789281.1 hypothetical protein [Roseococcus sp. SDR]MBV1844595.1 hypothetical protein [Roseococcus sp. SDR]